MNWRCVPRSLVVRLILLAGGGTALLVALLLFITQNNARHWLEAEVKRNAESVLAILGLHIEASPATFDAARLDAEVDRIGALLGGIVRISIVDGDGRIVADTEPGALGRPSRQPAAERQALAAQALQWQDIGGGVWRATQVLTRPGAAGQPAESWGLAIDMRAGIVEQRLSLQLAEALTLQLLGVLSFAIVTYLILQRWLWVPLRQITAAMRQVGQGNFDLPDDRVAATQEMRALWWALQAMAGELAALQQTTRQQQVSLERAELLARQREAQTQDMLESLPIGIAVFSASGELHYSNKAAAALLGKDVAYLASTAAISANPRLFIAGSETHYPVERLSMLRALHGDSTHFDDLELRRNGQRLRLEIWGAPVAGAGETSFAIAAFMDISEREKLQHELQSAYQLMHEHLQAISRKDREGQLLRRMGELMMACQTLDEAYAVVGKTLPELFPQTTGILYQAGAAHGLLEAVVDWGRAALPAHEQLIDAQSCWGLRRGQTHCADAANDPALPRCLHIDPEAGSGASLCKPMLAQGEISGFLHLRADSESAAVFDLPLVESVVEQLALALGNLRLRQTLRQQSLHDALTGLYNRRYLEDALPRELARSSRNGQALAVFMIDVDFFKKFNDGYGHEAGDNVLRALGQTIQQNCRQGDLGCRFGGEEFTVVLVNTGAEPARNWAERLMAKVRALEVSAAGVKLPAITISLGLALYPEHGDNATALLLAADLALYEAKNSGRNRLQLYSASAEAQLMADSEETS